MAHGTVDLLPAGAVKTYALAFDYTMTDLWYGHAFENEAFQLQYGDVVLDVVLQITEAFDGTTPLADAGAVLLGSPGYFHSTTGAAIDASLGDSYSEGFYIQNPTALTPSDLMQAQDTGTNTYRLWPAMNAAYGWPFSVLVNTTGLPPISAYCTADAPATYPVTIATGVNDEFVLTLLPSGVPMTFTIAPGTYVNIAELENAVNGSQNGSAQYFNHFANATGPTQHLAYGTPGGDLSTQYPITIATGINDTFYYTANGGGPVLYTIAPTTIHNIGEAETALYTAVNGSAGQFGVVTGVTPGNNGTGIWFQSEAFGEDHNGDTVTTGPNDALASFLLTSPVTLSGGVNGSLRFTQAGFVPILNGSTVSFGVNDAAADLGFTGNPDTFASGSGGVPSGSTVGSGVVYLTVVTPAPIV